MMRVIRGKGRKFFWPKLSLKKWLKVKHKGFEFSADENEGENETESESDEEEEVDVCFEGRHSCSAAEFVVTRTSSAGQLPRHSSAILMQRESEILRSQLSERHHMRVFVGTWNVGGKVPEESTDLDDWLELKDPADVYVIGFQEVVPLNAGNVLGAEDNVPPLKWLNLIRHTLNSSLTKRSPLSLWRDGTIEESPDVHKSALLYGSTKILGSEESHALSNSSTALDWCDNEENAYAFGGGRRGESARMASNSSMLSSSPVSSSRSFVYRCSHSQNSRSRYAMVAGKQMVGIFVSVWVRGDLRKHVHNLKVSCVNRGLMGYLGNKGSISISMCLYQTTFCFICSHLSSGEREGDESRRNSDVFDILKRTQFRRAPHDLMGMPMPETILEHDRIIWFGDLNYRLALSSRVTRTLLAKEDWETLLSKDQLHIEKKAGRVFEGWHEGGIHFAPTYKYRTNSDHYTLDKHKFGEKRRTPAWCDRILWYGKGLKQVAYVRGESRLSDHRPVHAVFFAEVDVLSRRKLKEFLVCSGAKVQAEELLPDESSNR